jgi:hypothetical protein
MVDKNRKNIKIIQIEEINKGKIRKMKKIMKD